MNYVWKDLCLEGLCLEDDLRLEGLMSGGLVSLEDDLSLEGLMSRGLVSGR